MAKKEKPILTEAQQKALDICVSSIEKQFGKGSIFCLDSKQVTPIDVIPTGNIKLDMATHIGGLPKGAIVEIYGPESSGKTTLALQVIAQAQRLGGLASIIDAEHALDMNYAKKLGVKPELLMIAQPGTGEEGLEIAETLIRSGTMSVIVIDSVAALVPKAEIEGEMGDSYVGLQARLMSQALRKIMAIVHRTNTCVIFINQLRMKIGVMYGCFQGETPVTLADGTQRTIKEIVDNKYSGPVLSYNMEAGRIETRKVVDWFRNGQVQEGDWRTLDLSSAGGPGGNMSFTSTDIHTAIRNRGVITGEAPVSSLIPGDQMLSWFESRILGSNTMDFITGSLLGDGHITDDKIGTAAIKLANQEQPEYLQWKLDKLSALNFISNGSRERPAFHSEYLTEIRVIRDTFYYEGGRVDKIAETISTRRSPRHLQLTPIAASVWFMDDGHYKADHRNASISIKRLLPDLPEDAEIVRKALVRFIGCNDVDISCSSSQRAITFSVKAFDLFSAKIASFVPSFMQYKLNPEDRGKYNDYELVLNPPTKQVFYVKVKDNRLASPRKYRDKIKYDIEIEGNHTYFVGGSNRGVAVHNSPETTTGGNALKFYASMRLDCRRIGQIKDGDQIIGGRCRVKVSKSKVAPPHGEAEFDMYDGQGHDLIGIMLEVAVDAGVVEQSGAWYSYKGEKIGQGRANVVTFLTSNPTIKEQIYTETKKVIEASNATEGSPIDKDK